MGALSLQRHAGLQLAWFRPRDFRPVARAGHIAAGASGTWHQYGAVPYASEAPSMVGHGLQPPAAGPADNACRLAYGAACGFVGTGRAVAASRHRFIYFFFVFKV